MAKKKILIIYTGGTIGMVPSERGFVPRSGVLEQAMATIPDMHRPEFPDWTLEEFSPLLDSSDLTVREWNKIGRTIADRYDDYDGFVVLHGTDTMAYTASALAFMLEHLAKPVILTGSQIPLCRLRSDGVENLVNAVLIAASDQVFEVCLCFGGVLLRGCRSSKLSADLLRAFDSPNFPHLAEIGIDIRYNRSALRPKDSRPLRLQEFREFPIGVLKVFPGIQFDLFESIMTEKLRGVVIEAFGSGNIPSRSGSDLLPIVERAYRSGTIITVCSQCPQGSVHLGAYAASRALFDAEAVDGGDMTIEAAVTKLYYLFSCGRDKAAVKADMERNLRGERSE